MYIYMAAIYYNFTIMYTSQARIGQGKSVKVLISPPKRSLLYHDYPLCMYTIKS